MLSKTNTIHSRWIALALFLLSSLEIPSVAESSPRVVHVFVALADNQHQGIIPLPPALGNGRDPQHNLYWGAAYGVKTYFKASENWGLAWSGQGVRDAILERCVFKTSKNDVYLVADAYGWPTKTTKRFGGAPPKLTTDTRNAAVVRRRGCSRQNGGKWMGGGRRRRRPFTI